MDWREAALAEAASLKPYYVAKYGWAPITDETDPGRVDLCIRLRGKRFPGRVFMLRLRYQPDWQQAGRREAFVDPDDPTVAGRQFWPDEGGGLNPDYTWNNAPTPVICLRGVWGFHSVLHPDRPMHAEDQGLLHFLVELQLALDG